MIGYQMKKFISTFASLGDHWLPNEEICFFVCITRWWLVTKWRNLLVLKKFVSSFASLGGDWLPNEEICFFVCITRWWLVTKWSNLFLRLHHLVIGYQMKKFVSSFASLGDDWLVTKWRMVIGWLPNEEILEQLEIFVCILFGSHR